MGDFNEILSQQEKQGDYPRAPWQIAAFRECLADCNLNDLGCRGSWFTWCNRRESPQTIRERLDRACCNDEWSSLFPEAAVMHIHEACSDHAAVFLSTDGDYTQGAKPKRSRFHFEAAWVRSEDCKTVIEKAWKGEIGTTPTKGLMHKIRSCRLDLLQWNRSSFGHISGRIKELNEQLNLDTNKEITDIVGHRHDRLRTELEELLEREETMWKQRGKALWLKEGDRSTSFFHATAMERRQRREIKKLKRNDGTIMERESDIQQVILEYFSTMFSSTRPNSGVIDEIVAPSLSVLYILNHHTLDAILNHTHIVLLPKCVHPESVSDFRPISLCNVIYNLASKAIANCLKPFLANIISYSQSAFVPGHLILDNVLVACEVNHYLAHKYQGNSGHVSLKLDLSKAYGHVECGMIRQAEEEGAIHGVRVCRNGPRVTHFLFADDMLIFCDANRASLELIRGLLAKFESCSGLQVNYQKSAVVFSRNVPLQTQEELANLLGVVRISKHEKYLGLPSIVGRLKREVFAGLKEKVWM
ncbi:UNVERIFIED_CONTAM: hypothetical protein Slati_1513700 [Sesamum latifolium]|uniref:Reverse transcriptase domain-containing protein n=1 Tax=Sesamum latifolium TaxID=2727402 RepID=A0AAW2X714_9LAMI